MRHAYLIIAHNEFDILEKTIKMIDDERNDIYIHIDKKVQNFDFDAFIKIPRKSKLIFTDRICVHWGGYSQIECEYVLFKAAAPGNYDYYHLLSGVDMPLVSQDVIHEFFQKNYGKEFVYFSKHDGKGVPLERIRYYYLFESLNRPQIRFLKYVNKVCLIIQKILRINRLKNCDLDIRYGANWISITDAFLKHILKNEDIVRHICKNSFCADEIFVQTLLYNSEYYKNVYCKADGNYEGIKRCIDWERGNPYIFREEDYDSLIYSNCFWVRKVVKKESGRLSDKIFEHVMCNSD